MPFSSGGGGGGGTTCSANCRTGGANCGVWGEVSKPGACSNGGLCCGAGPGPNPQDTQGIYAYCQDGNGPQYPLPGIRIGLIGNDYPPGGPPYAATHTYPYLTTDANGRAAYDGVSGTVLFGGWYYEQSPDIWADPSQPAPYQNPMLWSAIGTMKIAATGQLYSNLTKGDTHNSVFENEYQAYGWNCPYGSWGGGNCNAWFGDSGAPYQGGTHNPGGWATNIPPRNYDFSVASWGEGAYNLVFHFSNCTVACVAPVAPTLISPTANGTLTPVGGQVTLSWSTVANADKYDLELYPTGTSCADPSAFCTYAASGGGLTTPSYTFSPTGPHYFFRVRGMNTNCLGGNGTGAWNGTDFDVVSAISGTIYNDPQQSAIFNAGTGQCQTGSALTPQAPDAGTMVMASWPNGGSSVGTITGATFTIPNVPYKEPAVHAALNIPSTSQYRCVCPGGCSLNGNLSGGSANFYLSNIAKPWWQVSNGLVWAGQMTGQAVLSQIPPATCTPANSCTPALITRDQAHALDSSSYVITAGGTIAAQDLAHLSEDARPDHVIGATYNGQPENFAYFTNLSNTTFSHPDYAGGTLTKPNTPPANGKAYFSSADSTISGATWTVASGQSFVFFINGDLRVSTPIYVNSGGFLAFIVKGNITFDKSLGWSDPNQTQAIVSGVYIADGQIIVEGGNGGGDLKFVGEGNFIGWGGVQLNRQYANLATNNTHPMEVFRLRPDFLFNVPDGMTKPFQLWQETN